MTISFQPRDWLAPIPNCLVRVRRDDADHICRVMGHEDNGTVRVLDIASEKQMRVPRGAVRCGYQAHQGFMVTERPYARTRTGRGVGEVLNVRVLGGREQCLVEFVEDGERTWVPYENLALFMDPARRFLHGNSDDRDAERFRLRVLAHALLHWDQNTGALSRLGVDPLPHQIHLVHRILADGNLNWLIADDVGLGKTIEVGMLLNALFRRRGFERVLIVTPAGLVKQWQEELREKFGMEDFVIYGDNVQIDHPSHWHLYPRMITSIDRLKHPNHREVLKSCPDWSMVVFDEAHKLTRQQYGYKFAKSQRFELAEALRSRAEYFLFLSATPHQGRDDAFKALLELLRPEMIETLRASSSVDPSWLNECVFRNRKIQVTDAEGEFVFKGQHTTAIEIPREPEDEAFDEALQTYLESGYAAAERRGNKGRAIGFVMTVFRKLAASSPQAILRSLERRLLRIDEALELEGEVDAEDERFRGELEEQRASNARGAFFRGEREMLLELIEEAGTMVERDTKMTGFIEHILANVLEHNPREKLVIFTEYRATQEALVEALGKRFGAGRVVCINGSKKLSEKRDAVRRFNTQDSVQFLVSTEAGGEGLNMHHQCHHLVNYDLPWNPMRLVQRVGRIYRYGQTKRVIVLNLHAPSTLDGHIVQMMYARIDQIVRDLCELGEDFHEGLHQEIFGQLAELVDMETILEEARRSSEERTRQEIDAALERARAARDLQERFFEGAQQFDRDELCHELALGTDHIQSFVGGMLRELGCDFTLRHQGQVLDVRLTPELQRATRLNQNIRLTCHRAAVEPHGALMMDLSHPLMKHFIERARRHDFGGLYAELSGPDGARALMAMHLRWQNDQGRAMRDELLLAAVDEDGVHFNTPELIDWLSSETQHTPLGGVDRTARDQAIQQARDASERRLAELANRHIHPDSSRLLCAAIS